MLTLCHKITLTDINKKCTIHSMNKFSLAYLPLGISFVLLPALMVVGGRDLGACGTNNEAMDVFVQIMWFLIPSGWVVSFLCTPFLFIFRKTRKASFLLLLCFLIFPIYFVLCSMLTKYIFL